MADVRTAPYVKQMIGGKYLPEGYDWTKDANNWKVEGHIPTNRCYHCGFKFIGSQYAAYCVICDKAMNPGNEYLMPKVQTLVEQRIRIPEDITEVEYHKKLEDPPIKPKAVFTRADDLNEMI